MSFAPPLTSHAGPPRPQDPGRITPAPGGAVVPKGSVGPLLGLVALLLVAAALAAPAVGPEAGPLLRRGLLALPLGVALVAAPPRRLGRAGALALALAVWAGLRWGADVALGAGSVLDHGLAAARVGDLLLLAGALAWARAAGPAAATTLALGITALLALVGLAGLAPVPLLPWPQVDPGGGLLGSRNLTAAAVAVGLPLALALAPRAFGDGLDVPSGVQRLGRAALATALVAGAYLAMSGNRLGLLAGVFGGLVVLAVEPRLCRRLARPIPALAAGALVLALGLLSAQALPSLRSVTVTERLQLTRSTWALVQEAPLAGVGPGQWRVHEPAAAAGDPDLAWRPRFEPLFTGTARVPGTEGITRTGNRQPAHAHQDLLELWSELGPVGLLLLLALAGAGLTGLGATDARRRGAAAGLLACGLLTLGAFPLAQPEVLVLCGALVALGAGRRAGDRSGGLPAAVPPGGPTPVRHEPAPPLVRAALAPALALAAVPVALEAASGLALTDAREAAARFELERAADHHAAALARAPWSFEARRYGAWLEAVRRRPGPALAAAEAAHALRPHHPATRNDLGLALAAAGHPDEGLAELERALAMAPDDGRIAANLGQALVAAGRPAEAEPLLAQALDQNPNLTPAWQGLADAALARGDWERAVRAQEAANASRLRNRLAHH